MRPTLGLGSPQVCCGSVMTETWLHCSSLCGVVMYYNVEPFHGVRQGVRGKMWRDYNLLYLRKRFCPELGATMGIYQFVKVMMNNAIITIRENYTPHGMSAAERSDQAPWMKGSLHLLCN